MTNPNNVAHGTLTASAVSTVTLNNSGAVEVVNRTGTAEIYFTVGLNGNSPATPTIGGNDCYVVPAGVCSYTVEFPAGEGPIVVELISAGAESFTVVVGAPT